MKKSPKKTLSDQKPVTRVALREELMKFSTNADLRDLEARWERKFDEKLEENRKQTVSDIKAAIEDRDHELQGAHQDELDAMAGSKSAPPQWRSMPRRLTALEMDVEKIKDHLEIS